MNAANLAVFVSGRGRTLQNILDRCARGDIDAAVALVVASADCRALEVARRGGVHTEVIPGIIPLDRLKGLVDAHAIDLLVLAGYLKRLPIPPSLERRVLNIHPALLPGDGTPGRFGGPGMYGRRVSEAVLEAGETVTGCTVHWCTADYDAGPVVMRGECRVEPGDTPDTLAARVFELELEVYPEAIRRALAGRAADPESSRADAT